MYSNLILTLFYIFLFQGDDNGGGKHGCGHNPLETVTINYHNDDNNAISVDTKGEHHDDNFYINNSDDNSTVITTAER